MIDNAISQIDLVSPSLLDNVDYIENSLLVFDDISELNFSNHPIRVNGVVFALCIEGYSEVSVNLKEHKLTTNSLMLTFPEQIIQNFGKSESYSGLYIIISPHFIDRTLKSVKELLPFILYAKDNPCLTLTAEEVSTFKEYHSLLKSKIRMSDNKFRSEIVKGILISLFYDIYSIIDKKSAIHNNVSKTRKEEIYQSFMKELADNYKQERSVAFYANRLCLTVKH